MTEPKFKETEFGKIPEDWEVRTIEEIRSTNKYSISMGPFGSNIKSENFVSSGIPIIRGNNLQRLRFDESEFVYLTKQKADELKSSNAYQNDIVITHRGTLGQVGIIPLNSKFTRYVVSQSQMKLTCNPEIVNAYFVYYFLNSHIGQKLLLANTSQTGVPAIAQPLSSLKQVIIPVPKLNEQNQIVKILSDLDAKIELNRQMNQTLEQIVESLFKRWFVDFEFSNEKGKPYKSSGGEMVDSELGQIPKGWVVKDLGALIRFIKGKKPAETSKVYIKGYLPQILIENLDGVPPVFSNATKMTIVSEKDLLMVMDGASSGRIERGHAGVLGSTLAKIECTIGNSIIYYFLKNLQEEINRNTTGTSIPHTDKGRVEKYKIVIPGESLLEKFEQISYNTLEQIINNKEETKKLVQARDSLLPKLMSGQIRVKIPKESAN